MLPGMLRSTPMDASLRSLITNPGITFSNQVTSFAALVAFRFGFQPKSYNTAWNLHALKELDFVSKPTREIVLRSREE